MERDRYNMALLLDCFSGTLTDKQRQYLELYYNEDLSLAEIAELGEISRPGVYDIINRSRNKLTQLERQTGIVERLEKTRAGLSRALALAEETGADSALIDMLSEVSNGI